MDTDGLVYDNNLASSLPKSEENEIVEIDDGKNNSGGVKGIIQKSLEEVFHSSMIPYTEHVVLDRALPRVEDGLKPVQRRILYSMMELGLTPDKPYRKSARIVGDCMGKFHPHGDSSVYDAMVRMSQNFVLRGPLVDGHGNFGSVDGDSAAAMRYTEARMTPLALELLKDIEKDTVKWSLNFDDTLKEPEMLPGRFPNLLVNGASGIAVGVATNIPPHNLGEVIDGVCAYIENPKISLEEIMNFIKAPDFPTGGQLILGEGLKEAYSTGKGKIIVRAKVEVEKHKDRSNLVITEIPYQVNKSTLLQKIASLKEENKDKLSCISEIRDESDRKGMRAVIRLKKEANPKSVLEFLYKATSLQTSFALNMVAIAGGKPKLLNLLEIISYYTEYQREVVLKRTKFDFEKAKERAHILQGLLIAIKNIDEVIKIIKKSNTIQEAKNSLKSKFNLSEKQTQAILEMRLARLVNLEVSRLENELKELEEKMKSWEKIIASKALQLKCVKKELQEVKKQFDSKRKSEILKNADINIKEVKEALTASYNYVLAITAGDFIKKSTQKNYSMSKKEVDENSTIFDIPTQTIEAKSNDTIAIFTNLGNCIKTNIEKIKEVKWREKGVSLQSLDSNVKLDEKPIKILVLNNKQNLIFFTKHGMIKRTKESDAFISKTYFQAVKITEKDSLINVQFQQDESTVLMMTKFGLSLNFNVDEVPVQGRISGGVKGVNLEEKDEVVFAGQVQKNKELIIVTNSGVVKKISTNIFTLSQRYRKGLRYILFNQKSKEVCFVKILEESTVLAVDFGIKILPLNTEKIKIQERLTEGQELIKRKFIKCYLLI